MKDCTKQFLLFKGISNKKIQADFEGGEISSDAGVLFLREVENQMGLISKITDSLRDRRHPGYVKHQFCELLKQRIFQIACGYEDGNDSNELRNDPIMKMACERLPDDDPALASQPSAGLKIVSPGQIFIGSQKCLLMCLSDRTAKRLRA